MNLPDTDPEVARDKLHERYAEIEKYLVSTVEELKAAGIANPRWCAVARTHFEEGMMALHRALRDFPGDDPNNYGKVPVAK